MSGREMKQYQVTWRETRRVRMTVSALSKADAVQRARSMPSAGASTVPDRDTFRAEEVRS